jgi:hypothetical protein
MLHAGGRALGDLVAERAAREAALAIPRVEAIDADVVRRELLRATLSALHRLARRDLLLAAAHQPIRTRLAARLPRVVAGAELASRVTERASRCARCHFRTSALRRRGRWGGRTIARQRAGPFATSRQQGDARRYKACEQAGDHAGRTNANLYRAPRPCPAAEDSRRAGRRRRAMELARRTTSPLTPRRRRRARWAGPSRTGGARRSAPSRPRPPGDACTAGGPYRRGSGGP